MIKIEEDDILKKFHITGGIFLWTARVVGGLTVLMFLTFAIGEGISAPSFNYDS